MKRSEAFWILNEMYELANEAQKQALNIAQRDVEFVDLMQDVPVQRWIPVTERLPLNRAYILVTADGFVTTAHRYNDRFLAASRATGPYTVRGVTHWMPLPEPPNE